MVISMNNKPERKDYLWIAKYVVGILLAMVLVASIVSHMGSLS